MQGGRSAGSEQARASALAVRLAAFFGALFVVLGAQVPFLPVWLDWRGLTPAEIGIVTATPLMLRLVVTPTIALIADRASLHRQMIILLAWVGLAALLVLTVCESFWSILLFATISAVCLSSQMPLTETLAMSGVRRAGLDYGRMRLWGSLTFIATSFIGGAIVDDRGASAGIWVIAFGALVTVLAAHWLPAREQGLGDEVERDGGTRRERAGGGGNPLTAAAVVRFVTSPLMLAFLVAAGAVQSAHAVFYTFGAVHWRGQGISATWIGALWSIGVIVEIVLFMYSGRVVRAIGAVELLIVAGVAAVVRWTAMAFDPSLALLVPLQMLHGLTYGAAHVGAMHVLARAVPEWQAGTAQAVYATVTAGIGMGGAMLIAGPLYGEWGGRTYLLMAGLALIGLAAGLVLRTIWRRQGLHRQDTP